MRISSYFISCIVWMLTVLQANVNAQQVGDELFKYPIQTPTYTDGNGPLILFDQAHNNGVNLRGNYKPFATLLKSDGCLLEQVQTNFDAFTLDRAKILITVNAMADPTNWDLPAQSAFSQDEIFQIVQWVENGGSLLLITDHMPCGGAVQELARRFDINIFNGFALRNDRAEEIFSRKRGSLFENEITNHNGKNIDSIMCWGGTGMIIPSSATALTHLGKEYSIYLPNRVSQIESTVSDTVPQISGVGIANSAYLRYGKGRVLVFGDGASFSAQLQGIKSKKRGMNHPSASQNAQFLLNIIHWLDHSPE